VKEVDFCRDYQLRNLHLKDNSVKIKVYQQMGDKMTGVAMSPAEIYAKVREQGQSTTILRSFLRNALKKSKNEKFRKIEEILAELFPKKIPSLFWRVSCRPVSPPPDLRSSTECLVCFDDLGPDYIFEITNCCGKRWCRECQGKICPPARGYGGRIRGRPRGDCPFCRNGAPN